MEEYRAKHAAGAEAEVPSDQMSVFYKAFLDESLPVHRQYARCVLCAALSLPPLLLCGCGVPACYGVRGTVVMGVLLAGLVLE